MMANEYYESSKDGPSLRVKRENKLRDDTEVATTPSDTKEEVDVLHVIGLMNRAIRADEGDLVVRCYQLTQDVSRVRLLT